MFRTNCLICNSENLKEIIDLGMQPFADTFIPKKEESNSENIYPLICDLCLDCGQIQTRCITDPIERYCKIDYSYTSSNSNFSRTHWINFVEEVSKKINLEKNSFVVEIGSNDGFLAEQFLIKENKVLGIDPSSYMADLAKQRKVETIVNLFNSDISKQILEKYGKANLIIANNVFNHSNNPLDFAIAVKELLAENGTFVYELPYWYIGFKTGKFDQIYHEHVSYFTAKSSKKILELAGISIKHIEVVDYHGGSLRVYACHKDELKNTEEVDNLIKKESEDMLFDLNAYSEFMKKLFSQRNAFLKKIHEIKTQNIPIIAVGAAAKGNTFLNFYNLSHQTIDYVTDSSPHKQGKFTPLSRIPIVSDNIFSNYNDVYALILSWNIKDQLKSILDKINPNIKFISPEEI